MALQVPRYSLPVEDNICFVYPKCNIVNILNGGCLNLRCYSCWQVVVFKTGQTEQTAPFCKEGTVWAQGYTGKFEV